MKKKNMFRKIVLCIALIVFLASAGSILYRMYQYKHSRDAFNDLRNAAQVEISEEAQKDTQNKKGNQTKKEQKKSSETENSKENITPKEENKKRQEKVSDWNNDYYGWLRIDGTNIDYPVMYTPKDPEHYLRRAFDGSDSISGTPFLDGYHVKGSINHLVYAHNMNDGSMFADLLKYRDDSFYKNHRYIRFDTSDGAGIYEIFSFFEVDITNPNTFRFYNFSNINDENTFNRYVKACKSLSAYDTGVTSQYGDKLLTLSTCADASAQYRTVVVAKKVI